MPSPAPILAVLMPLVAATGGISAAPDPSVHAPPSRGLVIVLGPTSVDELTTTALARVTGELTAARFQVIVVPLDPNLDPTPQVETVAPESPAVAAFAIAHMTDSNGDMIAIWVCDRLGRRTTIQRMTMRGDNVSQDAEVLALEAIELIRGSIAGLWPAPPRAPPQESSSRAMAKSRERPEISVGLGIAMLREVGIPAAQWMGSLTARVRWPRGLLVEARLTGLGPALTLAGSFGTAAVHREVGSLGLGWIFWTGGRMEAWVAVAGGAEHLGGQGAAPDPARGTHTGSAWLALASAGLGAAARLGARISLCTDVVGVWTWPALDLRIADTRTEPFSQPGVLVNAGLRATF